MIRSTTRSVSVAITSCAGSTKACTALMAPAVVILSIDLIFYEPLIVLGCHEGAVIVQYDLLSYLVKEGSPCEADGLVHYPIVGKRGKVAAAGSER